MENLKSSGQAAAELGITRDALLFALQSGAPEPKAGRLAGRRMFSQADLEALVQWFAARGREVAWGEGK